jgi:threonine aldolase
VLQVIDLRSDTVTRPTPAMYAAMNCAPLGDDVLGDDPTVQRLEAMAAERLGKEAGLFVPSGTMGNLLAARLFARPGDQVVCETRAHLYRTSVLAMASANPIALVGDKYGRMNLDELAVALKPDPYTDAAALMCLENSFNGAGGSALSVDYVSAAAAVAHERGVPVHLDGARLFNAAVALGVPAEAIARHADTVMFCISKGLSAPVGSLLVGTRAHIAQARHLRHLHGGAMRQVGILAACGIVALESMVDRLAEDHANCRLIAEGMARIPGIAFDLDVVQTNLIWFDIAGTGIAGEAFCKALEAKGVLVIQVGPTAVRIATHKDVSREQALVALGAIQDTVKELGTT